MANSYTTSVASGLTSVFSVPFPYISREHVKVLLDGVAATGFTFLSDGEIEITPRPAAGVLVRRQRVTPRTPLVDFQLGNLDPADLDRANAQAIYVAEEALDTAAGTLAVSLSTGQYDAGGLRIGNVAAGSEPDDAATLGQLTVVTTRLDGYQELILSAADRAENAEAVATSSAAVATSEAGRAETAARLLESPDYGFFTEAPVDLRDYGSFA